MNVDSDGLVAREQSGSWTDYVFDQQGNVAQRLDDNQNVTSSSTYTAYGAETSTGGPNDVFGYNARYGYILDRETGLYLCQHRYYDPGTGRWLTRDPFGGDWGEELYLYCDQSPGRKVDPGGFMPELLGNPWWTILNGSYCAYLLYRGIVGTMSPSEVCEACSRATIANGARPIVSQFPKPTQPFIWWGGYAGKHSLPMPWCHPSQGNPIVQGLGDILCWLYYCNNPCPSTDVPPVNNPPAPPQGTQFPTGISFPDGRGGHIMT